MLSTVARVPLCAVDAIDPDEPFRATGNGALADDMLGTHLAVLALIADDGIDPVRADHGEDQDAQEPQLVSQPFTRVRTGASGLAFSATILA